MTHQSINQRILAVEFGVGSLRGFCGWLALVVSHRAALSRSRRQGEEMPG
jgi:hypothetical protein